MRLDLVIQGARIRTLDPERPEASTVGVWNGHIVGLDEQIAGDDAVQVIDARGLTIVPGFHDAHCHTTSFGLADVLLDLSAAVGRNAVLDAVARKARTLAAGEWVIGVGYGVGMDPDERLGADALDRASSGRPVWLTHLSGHRCSLSRTALGLVGVTGALPPGVRGAVDVDGTGRPSGLLEESAMDLVKDYVGPSSIEQLTGAVDRATRVYASEGITSFTDAGIGSSGLDHSPVEVAAYQRARETGRLHARAQLMVHNEVLHPVRSHRLDRVQVGLDLGLRTGLGDAELSLGAVKIWVDGSGLSGTGPQFDNDPEVLRTSVITAHRAGWQVAAHAMGEEAVDLVLNALDEATAGGPNPARDDGSPRHRIEHGGMIRADQIRRLAAHRMTVVTQPIFITAFGDTLAELLGGGGRAAESLRVATLLEAGVEVAASSDRPVAPGAPLPGMQAMVQRRTASGADYGPADRVDAATALHAYTVAGARAARSEHLWGCLRPRLLADFTVLSADPTTTPAERIGTIEVLATLVGGRTTHDPEGLFTRA